MPPEKITSLQNPRLKELVKLRDRRARDEAGSFLIEGYREIVRALDAMRDELTRDETGRWQLGPSVAGLGA